LFVGGIPVHDHTLPSATITSVETELTHQLKGLWLGCAHKPNTTVSDTIKYIMQHQGESVTGPNGEVAFGKLADKIHAAVSSVQLSSVKVEVLSTPRRKISSAQELSSVLADQSAEIERMKVEFQNALLQQQAIRSEEREQSARRIAALELEIKVMTANK